MLFSQLRWVLIKLSHHSQVQYLYPVVSEARKIPLEINDNGDVLLTNPVINFEAEYSASHKLLLQYDKINNREPMKY